MPLFVLSPGGKKTQGRLWPANPAKMPNQSGPGDQQQPEDRRGVAWVMTGAPPLSGLPRSRYRTLACYCFKAINPGKDESNMFAYELSNKLGHGPIASHCSRLNQVLVHAEQYVV